jgi:hypothetical protein
VSLDAFPARSRFGKLDSYGDVLVRCAGDSRGVAEQAAGGPQRIRASAASIRHGGVGHEGLDRVEVLGLQTTVG